VDDIIPSEPPKNWDTATIDILTGPEVVATAEVTRESMSAMSAENHVELEQKLEAERDDSRQQVADLVGTGIAAWKYQATITEVAPGSALDGLAAVGDTISGFQVMDTTLEDTNPSDADVSYRDLVITGGSSVIHDGETVWEMDHTGEFSAALLQLGVGSMQTIYLYDRQAPEDAVDGVYYTMAMGIFQSGHDMLPDGTIPERPPQNWSNAAVHIRDQSGLTIARAVIVENGLVPMSAEDHGNAEAELSSDVSDLETSLDAANADIAAKQAQIDALTAELATANADIAAKQAQIDTLTAELATANADIAAKQAQIDTLTAELATANADIAAKQAQIDTLTAELATANADIAAKQAQIDTLTAEKAGLQAQLDAAHATITALEQDVEELETANAGLTTQVESVEGSLSALETALGNEFNDPEFSIPGDTPETKAENLRAALLSLNPGQRQAVFKALGGNKNGHRNGNTNGNGN
jgi:predicted  nucleic acid-binding Zn-ribbon protein